ncbi:recombinase family protein [Streptomyces sp. NBC_00120]|uniref:Recombinase family protein n=1 Tax=Streptomyces sp. NBC_00119 TaxID=2975659 RepID=A0AAU1U518_9ACTN|nr:recombinase family protein [Streptomyces sp. NBC_00120]
MPHPVPARRAEGRTKHRLIPDPPRASAVTHIFQLRGLDKLGYDAIADRLNPDLVVYPPPERTRPDVALGRWSGSAVREILRNPKYTGYQVWNRRAMKEGGRYNDPKDWVWSSRPAHEPLVTRELFDAVSTVGRKRQGSRTTHGAKAHPATKRSYVLRSYIYCDIRDRRMFGKTRHQISYYACQPDPNENRDQPWSPHHPKSLWIREQSLVTSISRFFATRIFGLNRRSHLTAALEAARSADDAGDRIANERATLEHAISALSQRQARLIRTLADGFGSNNETDDLDSDQEMQFRDAIRQEHATLSGQRKQLAEQLAHLRAPQQAVRPADSAALLDALPHLDMDLALVPEEIQRRLYSAFGLEVRYSRPREELTLWVMIPGCLVDGLVPPPSIGGKHAVSDQDGPSPDVVPAERGMISDRSLTAELGVSPRPKEGTGAGITASVTNRRAAAISRSLSHRWHYPRATAYSVYGFHAGSPH